MRLGVLHAELPPGEGLTSVVAAGDSRRAAAADQLERFVAGSGVDPAVVVSIQRLLEHGHSASLLAERVGPTPVDSVVLGSQGRSGVARMLLGSTAEHLLHALDCDTLVVRPR